MNKAQLVVQQLLDKHLTVATAESCTAGLLSAAITEIPGSSAVFPCGVSAYTAQIKRKVLQVPLSVLELNGTVSAPTALAMAQGVRTLGGADIGVSITGVAGPSPSEGKPVGTVFVALTDGFQSKVTPLSPTGEPLTRQQVREKAVQTALEMILEYTK